MKSQSVCFAVPIVNLECRVDKDVDGRITEEEIKEVWNHKLSTEETFYMNFLLAKILLFSFIDS
jgi:hypothetical protein